MTRFLVVVALLLSVSWPAAAQIGEGPPMPSAMDLKKVPVGSWADYKITLGALPAMSTRMALVNRASGAVTVEMIVEGGMMAAAGKMIMQTVLGLEGAAGGSVKKLLLQVGENDPMEMPNEMAQNKQFQRPDPKALVKEETVAVPAGTFKAKHYRDKTPKGDTLEYWISDRVPPFGLVKLAGQQTAPGSGGMKNPVSFELTAQGKDARSRITKTARPFDQQALMGQLMAGAQAAAGRGAPGAVAAPPAAPAAPAAPAK